MSTADVWVAQYGRVPIASISDAGAVPAGQTKNAIGAYTDAVAVQKYLRAKRFTDERRAVFLTELARWTWFLAKRGCAYLAEADLDTIHAYDDWLLTPASRHAPGDVGPRAPLFLADGRFNPAWRPVKPHETGLSEATVEWCLSLIRALYAWLEKGEYLGTNPFALVSQRRRTDGARPGDVATGANYQKSLSFDTLRTIGDYLNGPAYRGSERRRAADRWLLHLLFETGHRAAAAAALTVDHLVPLTRGITELSVVGKGSRNLHQEWTPALQAGLQQYRAALGLSWPPASGETRHLYCGVHDRRCRATGVSATQLYRTVQRIGRHTDAWLATLERIGITRLSPRERDKLRRITPHVIRHTTATLRINVLGETVREVCTHLGHATESMTETYIERGLTVVITPEVARAQLRAMFLPAIGTASAGTGHRDETHENPFEGTPHNGDSKLTGSRF